MTPRSSVRFLFSLLVAVSLSARFSGQWQNITFGTSGPVSLVITGDTYTQLYTGTATTGGNVFGGASPPAQTYADIFTLAGGTYTSQSSFYGKETVTVSPTGQITGTLTDVPSTAVSGTTFTGAISPPTLQAQTITLDSTIALRPAGTARCLTTLNRQP